MPGRGKGSAFICAVASPPRGNGRRDRRGGPRGGELKQRKAGNKIIYVFIEGEKPKDEVGEGNEGTEVRFLFCLFLFSFALLFVCTTKPTCLDLCILC